MKIHLIDGSGYIHRAYHAVRPLRTSRGLPVNALFGFAQMLRKFLRDEAPAFAAVVFDAGRVTFRNELFGDYKANRAETEADLAAQFPYARLVPQVFGLPVVEAAGFEADDVIATLARRAIAAGFEVVVLSSDKDLLQLVGPGVTVFDPAKERSFDAAGVVGRVGVPPERVVDWLALVGDASDNVPGVKGIGDKGATELIAAYGPLEAIYEHLDDLTPRKRDLLLAGRDSAFLSRDLATLRSDVDLALEPTACRVLPPDPGPLVDLLTELEFKALLADIRKEIGVEAVEAVVAAPVELRVLEAGSSIGWDAALACVAGCPSPALAALFRGRDPDLPDCAGLAIATGPADAIVVRPDEAPEGFLARLADALTGRPFAASPYKEIRQLFASRGCRLPLPAQDPVLAAYLVQPERENHSLDALSLEVLGEPLPPPSETGAHALAQRAVAVARIRDPLAGQVEAAGLTGVLADTEIPIAALLADMERTGVTVDRAALQALSISLGSDMQRIEKAVIDAAGMPFNPNSPKQLADVLFGKLGLPVVKKTKTGPSTDVTVLEELSERHPVPRLILEYRSVAKLKSTYADALANLINPRTGRVHTSYNQMVTATGRLSSSDPNLQNIPVRTEAGLRIRAAFVSRPGYEFVSADYSQIELRVLAHLSGDAQLTDAFRRGLDIHSRTAARVFSVDEAAVTSDQRRIAKVVNFGLLYGMGPFRLARDLGIPMAEAQRIIADYFGAFPAVRTWLDATLECARTNGWVATLNGRRRYIEGIGARNHNDRASAERMATNAPVQGTAADILKVAMVRLARRIEAENLPALLVMQVHDELVLEVEEGFGDTIATVLREEMENAERLDVPLVVEVGRGKVWSDLKL